MKITYLPLTLCAALALTGCENTTINKEDVGTVTGGVLGGVLGSQVHGSGRTAAIIGGSLVGAFLGGSIGKTMDEVDRMKVNQTLESTPTNKTSAWTNPDSGTCYQVTPTKTYYRETQGATQPCREFTTTAIIGGKRQQVYGTACRQADGSWKATQ